MDATILCSVHAVFANTRTRTTAHAHTHTARHTCTRHSNLLTHNLAAVQRKREQRPVCRKRDRRWRHGRRRLLALLLPHGPRTEPLPLVTTGLITRTTTHDARTRTTTHDARTRHTRHTTHDTR